MSFAKLDELCRSLSALDHALAILGADEAIHMATGGGGDRADAMGRLTAMSHRMLTAPEVADWIEAARREQVDPEQQAALRELARVRDDRTALEPAFVERQIALRMRCEQLWRSLRDKSDRKGGGDWQSFEPALAEVVALAREEASIRAAASGLNPYDALIEQHDPGTRVGQIEPLFEKLKAFIAEFLPVALEAQKRRDAKLPKPAPGKTYANEDQRKLGLAIMAAVGFDFAHGSLAVSHHPFCGGVPSDVRITTRYKRDDFVSSFMSVMHEAGHALYEQNLPKKWEHWPCGKARGMAMHESQSLFVEKQIGRNPAFWRFALPLVAKHLGVDWSEARIVAQVQQVERGYIRVEADEVTYPLHVILRFELERELIAGTLAVRDIPQAWDGKMNAYLGLRTLDNPRLGPMQDVHWPAGIFGYFPSYTLGAVLAAQQWAAIKRQHPDIETEIASGKFKRLNEWRRDNIWSKGSIVSADEIMIAATGEPMAVEPFLAHLQSRYGG